MSKILIVGGGTAGWITACYLAKVFGAAAPEGVCIDLIESPAISPIGVGEATFPSIRGTLSQLGLDEGRFLAAASATFKQGIRFSHWVRPPGAPGPRAYFHPFSQPSQRGEGPELLPYWLLGVAPEGVDFATATTLQARVVAAGHGPKRVGDGDYRGAMNYAYHFDAADFAALLAEHGRLLGVRHHQATVERVERDHDGGIARVVTAEQGAMEADLYVDCSGQRALLIGDTPGSPFRSRGDVLFADRALAAQVPYAHADGPIPSCTDATAQAAGWIWDIPLRGRRGVGYVYSSAHSGEDAAEAAFMRYLGSAGRGVAIRRLRFETGYRPQPWRHNCVAIGLAGGFVEPLESTGIALVELGAYLLAHLWPVQRETMAQAAAQFNAMMSARYERILDFIKMHYCLSQRRDTAFWRDNVDPASVPDRLRDRLEQWRWRPPHRLDFVTDLEMFLPPSWQFVLYGMEFRTDLAPMRQAYPHAQAARREFAMIEQVAARALRDLPPHRDVLEHLTRGYPGPAPRR